MAFKIPEFDFKGIKRITIPKTDSDFLVEDYGWSIIKKYLPSILSAHAKNAKKIQFLYNYYLGEQDILAKERPHKINEDNNNKNIENHANRQVDFKTGFLCGERRDYTHKADSDSDDLIYLDRYFTDCNFFSKDIDLKEWIYATGIGTTCTKPRTDIIVSDGVDELTGKRKSRYMTRQEGFDIEHEAPFKFNCVNPTENFVVYSSGIDKEPLFCVSCVETELKTDIQEETILGKELLIETRYASFRFNSDYKFSEYFLDNPEVKIKSLNYLPIIEFAVNKDRIGIVEKNRSSFNMINLIRSSVSDTLVDNANAILVFKNVDITSEEVQEMRKAGAIIISDSQNARNGAQADLKTVTLEIRFDELATYVDQITTNCYDIVGVPMASGQVTSGGDTGQARLLGGGWNNAYIIIHKEIEYLLGQDYEQLKLILLLCKQVTDCPINELYASQVDINYRVNQNDNLLIKAQSMKYLYDMGCPLEFIMKVGGLSNDIKTDTKNWRLRLDELRSQQI